MNYGEHVIMSIQGYLRLTKSRIDSTNWFRKNGTMKATLHDGTRQNKPNSSVVLKWSPAITGPIFQRQSLAITVVVKDREYKQSVTN